MMLILLIQVKQENLGQSTEKADYCSTYATITFFSKDKALYKSCGEPVEGGKNCQKKIMEQVSDDLFLTKLFYEN